MDRKQFEMIVREHQAMVYRYVRYLGAGAVEAEDVVQETFLAAFGNRKQPDADDHRGMSAWLRAIARNKFLQFCRRERREVVDSDFVEQAEAVWTRDFLADGDGFGYAEALRECLDTVPENQRQALDLRYRERESRQRMAELLRLTEDGVKSLLRRVRAALGKCIQRRLAEEGV